MGQDIKYIITTQKIKVPIYIVHFEEGNATVFPMLMEDSDFERMSDYSKESNDNVSSFFDTILCGGYNLEYPTKRMMTFIQSSGLRSLAIIAYREICDLPQNAGMPVLFIDDKLFDLKQLNYDFERQILEDEIHKILSSEILSTEIINNEERYWSYEGSEIYYLQNLKNCH